ncbi:hypothetical protein MNEG_3474 [Monoraphidium neglectum]|uniref:F-box domain-containing protein n=1 Tax=Monoraphidium neglectum TaxID=145388 RepID=A0A0D2MVE6_9CHLO|nr:hypothetical protein MNEG_3474 [Monoraphidium neglectum]KIZ04482.1 hypothetical protein MNEG_3474 [Monoraphidium neglectum]|eukprot:XP_013903501.1 hypothetical protein MNEG_3474 [Monoraphidium neglectum]
MEIDFGPNGIAPMDPDDAGDLDVGSTPLAPRREPIAAMAPAGAPQIPLTQPASTQDRDTPLEEHDAPDRSGGGDGGVEDPDRPAAPPPGPAISSHLARLLAAAPAPPSAVTGAQLLLLAAHAAMLETGFAPRRAGGGGNPSAAAAGGGGDRGVGADAAPGAAAAAAADVEALLSSAVGGTYTMRYSLEPNGSDGPAVADAARAGATAGGGGAGATGEGAGEPEVVLSLGVSRFCRPAAPPQTGAAAAAAAAAWAPLAARLADAPALWLQLRDRVALPLLAAARAAAGLPPPVGLLTLPWELQEAWLKLLPAKDLASLAGSCCQLRNLGSLDSLWLPLFEAEFPHASPAERADGNAHGWKAAFAEAWRRRAARRRAAHRLLRPHARPFPPAPAPWAPLLPPGGPRMPPNVIGGDYDRLPGGLGYFGGPGGVGGGGGPFVGPSGFFTPSQGFGGGGGPLGGGGGGPPFAPGFRGGGRRGGAGGQWRLY